MPNATETRAFKQQPSLFTRLRAVEAELEAMKAELSGLKEDHEALRKDREEWRWRAERLLAERTDVFFERWGRRMVELAKPSAFRLNALLQKRWPELRSALLRSPVPNWSRRGD